MSITFHFIKAINAKNAKILLGFPGVGLVGSIVATYIARSEDFELVGYVLGKEFAPLAAIHDFTPLPPVRIYYSKKHNTLLFLSEIVIPLSSSSEFAEEIIKLAKRIKASEIMVLGGLTRKSANAKGIYVVGCDRKRMKEIIDEGLAKSIKEGATTGVAGIVLGLSTMHNLSSLALLAEADPDFADPSAALNLLRCFKKISGMEIDESDLMREVKRKKKTEREVLRTTSFQKPLGPMYG
jgi:uncharacterized protein